MSPEECEDIYLEQLFGAVAVQGGKKGGRYDVELNGSQGPAL